ncbi:hypothetical protein ARMSODRAFT_979388 [Armillaria solidipes]|uniref:Uncharacterized protein n=1 Tax=Armillaria solidipes TaxID=1076256 RepID=A0A2H3BJF2_9AGAR|nr:hypothetical protein ARMSODRAFT_979388 [Armillaria solidipes]
MSHDWSRLHRPLAASFRTSQFGGAAESLDTIFPLNHSLQAGSSVTSFHLLAAGLGVHDLSFCLGTAIVEKDVMILFWCKFFFILSMEGALGDVKRNESGTAIIRARPEWKSRVCERGRCLGPQNLAPDPNGKMRELNETMTQVWQHKISFRSALSSSPSSDIVPLITLLPKTFSSRTTQNRRVRFNFRVLRLLPFCICTQLLPPSLVFEKYTAVASFLEEECPKASATALEKARRVGDTQVFHDAVLLINILGRPRKLGDFCTSSVQGEDGTGRRVMDIGLHPLDIGKRMYVGATELLDGIAERPTLKRAEKYKPII